jgi:drug/metabolite transporter (DMT)-like permease
MTGQHSRLSTTGGLFAVVFWSSSVCVCGSIIPRLGVFLSAGLVYLLSGTLAMLALLPGGRIRELRRLSLKRLLFCGLPFIIYIVLFYSATGMAKTGRLLIEVGLLNYLWPAFALILSVRMQGCKATPLLPLGVLISLSGIFMASAAFNSGFSLHSLFADIVGEPLPCALAFIGAVLWAVYCNTTRMLQAESTAVDIPLFMLSSGIILLPLGLLFGERPVWSMETALALGAAAIFPGFLACVLWDLAMRKGNFVLVSAFAYLAPVMSTIMTGLLFGVELGLGILTACLLVALGALLCHVSIKPASS